MLTQKVFGGILVLAAPALLFFILGLHDAMPSRAQVTSPAPAPPADQTYIGSKQCSSCHFDQYLAWRQTKHFKAFDILPAKYRTDSSCLKCHTTGHGQPTGYSGASTPDLVGTSCEACHGPGSKHAEIAKPFATKKPSAEEEAYSRSTIHKVIPNRNVCVECHQSKGHKKHPAYDK